MYPKISIVTPSYNSGDFLEETILSILNQKYQNLEYIIIDGGSTDNTLDIIRKYENRITYWVSEPDKGQADAINKGFLRCTGEIFNWINADDYLAENALEEIAKAWNSDYDIIACDVINFLGKENFYFKQSKINYSDMLLSEANFHQPGFWCNLQSLKKHLPFITHFHYCFDVELFIRFTKDNPKIKFIEKPLIYFRLHDESKTYGNPRKMQDEFNMIRSLLLTKFKETKLTLKFHDSIHKKNMSQILSYYCNNKIIPKSNLLFLLSLIRKVYFNGNKLYYILLLKSLINSK